MGLVEMQEQEMNKMKHEQAEHAVRQVASSSGGTAQVFEQLQVKLIIKKQ